jgi:NarL family two-component system response regulator LiaR
VSGATPVRVLLVDDHAVVRKGLRALFDREPGVEVVGEADGGEQAVAAFERARPDVALMDLEMPGVDGTEATRRITEAHPDARVVILTSHASEEEVFPALEAGAVGYLLKHSAPDDVLRAIAGPARARPSCTRRSRGWSCRTSGGRRRAGRASRSTRSRSGSWRCCSWSPAG